MPKTKIEIIYQAPPQAQQTADNIIVINKPAGVSVTKDRSGAVQLLDILTEQLGPEAAGRLRLVHRLDKHTSGVMILAANVQTQSAFSSFFEKRLVKKTYLAIVSGIVRSQQGSINAPLTRNRRNPAVMCLARKKGKDAITNWKLLADFGSMALLAVQPLTGRTHQIRVHLPSIELPLKIDPLYGSSRPLFLSDFKQDYRLGRGQTEKPLIERLTLHAYQIQLPNDGPGRPDCFIARLDKKFTAAIKMLTKHNPKGQSAFADPDYFSKIINNKSLD